MKRIFVGILGSLLALPVVAASPAAAGDYGYRHGGYRPPCDNICRGPVAKVVRSQQVVTHAPRVVRERQVVRPVRHVDVNRVILHQRTVIHRQPVIVHREVVSKPIVVRRHNVAHKYVTQHRTVVERRVVTRHVRGAPEFRDVKGITKVCPTGDAHSCRSKYRGASLKSGYVN